MNFQIDIGRRGPIQWPARLSDLSPNFVVYTPQPQNVEDLRESISENCHAIQRDDF